MSASPRSVLLLLGLILSLCAGNAAVAQAQTQSETQNQSSTPASLWADFNHYTLVARPKLAKDAATALLKQVNKSQLLDIVESSDYAGSFQNTLVRAQKIDALHDVAVSLAQEIQSARIGRARDPKRIARNIALLDQGQRAYINAVARLKGAGQYAAPQLLAALQDDHKQDLHPYIINAMKAIGKPLVRPLAAALPHLKAATMGQVAQVLAAIDYPGALPVLRSVAESKSTDGGARRVVQAAYTQLLANSAASLKGVSAADLYVEQGQQAYAAETAGKMPVGYDPAHNSGIIWNYNEDLGLVPVAVPSDIYGDVLAMRAARKALTISPNMDMALSLWLTANLRRANHLSPGQQDPTYGQHMRQPKFYAMLAGPQRLQDVLTEALKDHDSQLALDAIDALQKTAGANALINEDAGRRPLLEALSYPDARVRFHAAVALAQARPHKAFPGADRVVPVLAESVRASGAKYAVVLADNQQRRNDLASWLHTMGYEPITGKTLASIGDAIHQRPGVDLIVVDKPLNQTREVYARSLRNYKLAAVPMLALASPSDQMRLQSAFNGNRRVNSAVAADEKGFKAAVNATVGGYTSASLSGKQSTQFALTALKVLRGIAWNSAVYNVADAEPALIHAVADKREAVAEAAAGVLAMVNDQAAQQALAKQAFEASQKRQIVMLNSLSDSATHYGDMLDSRQTARISKLVENGTGELAIAAARAHGALTLPTSSAVKMILK